MVPKVRSKIGVHNLIGECSLLLAIHHGMHLLLITGSRPAMLHCLLEFPLCTQFSHSKSATFGALDVPVCLLEV